MKKLHSLFFLKKLKVPFLFEEIKSLYFIWRIKSPLFLFEKIESPYFFLKKLNPFILFEELKVPFFIWRNWKSLFYLKKLIPLLYLKNLKSPFLFEKVKVLFLFQEIKPLDFIWRIKSPIFKQYKFFYENQLVFASIIFILKINTKFSIAIPVNFQLAISYRILYWFCYIFEIAILYWKSMIIFRLKINWFASFKNFRISLYFLYRDFQRHFSIDFAILLKLPFYIKNLYKFFYWKSNGFFQHHFSTENQ